MGTRSNMYPQSLFGAKISQILEKNLYILHGQVFVMISIHVYMHTGVASETE